MIDAAISSCWLLRPDDAHDLTAATATADDDYVDDNLSS
jgi:hypothetical protein